MRDVLVFLSSNFGNRLSSGAQYALGLADACGARLSALIADIEPLNVPSPKPDTMQAYDADAERRSLAEQLTRIPELLLAAANAADVPCEILAPDGDFLTLRERVIYSAQLRDVLIVDVYGPLQSQRKDIVDGALFGSGRPLVLVPQQDREFAADRIVIAWDATRSAVRAVHDVLPLLRRAREVAVVSVSDDKEISPPDTGNGLCRYLALWDIAAKFERIDSGKFSVGTVLLDYARQVNADLLVMGGFAHGFERELMLGSATRDVYQADLETVVLLSH
jgi:nucleotide-binding universal stress UspA family protein